MTIRLDHRPQAISIEGAVTLRLRRAGWLRSPDGRVWLTRTHGGGDLILAPGAWQWVQPGTHWVIEPLHPRASRGRPLRVEWQPLPSHGTSWRLLRRHLVDRLRGEAAWEDAARARAASPRLPC